MMTIRYSRLTSSMTHIMVAMTAMATAIETGTPTTLRFGQSLEPGQFIHGSKIAANGEYLDKFGLDDQGKLYMTGGLPPVFFPEADGGPGSKLIMQGDGNLVIYDANEQAVYSSGTEGNHGAELFIDDDSGFAKIVSVEGNLLKTFMPDGCVGAILQSGESLKPGEYICYGDKSFGLTEDGRVECGLEFNLGCPSEGSFLNGLAASLIMQKDGNLVAYDAAGVATWTTNTEGNPVSALYADGIRDSGGNYIWTYVCWD